MHQKEQASSLMVEEWILKEKHWNVANGIARTCVVIDGRIRKFCQRKIQISHLDNTCSTCLVIFYLYKEEYIKKKDCLPECESEAMFWLRFTYCKVECLWKVYQYIHLSLLYYFLVHLYRGTQLFKMKHLKYPVNATGTMWVYESDFLFYHQVWLCAICF